MPSIKKIDFQPLGDPIWCVEVDQKLSRCVFDKKYVTFDTTHTIYEKFEFSSPGGSMGCKWSGVEVDFDTHKCIPCLKTFPTIYTLLGF